MNAPAEKDAAPSRAKTCPECSHRAGRHSKGWGCNALGCDCVEQPPFRVIPPASTDAAS